MRLPHFAWSRLKLGDSDEAAVYSLTGIATSPKEIVPEPSERGGISCPPWELFYLEIDSF
jgi:hypothetical protein